MSKILLIFLYVVGLGALSSFSHSAELKSFIVETLPKELVYNETVDNVHQTSVSLLQLINSAKHSIDIASMYWSMLGHDVMENPVPESKTGEDILNALIDANKTRSVQIRIAVNADWKNKKNEDLQMLKPYAQIRQVNFTRLIGSGILHTKFIIVDGSHFYLGSANMDWRALTHVKELGIIINDNPELAKDLMKIFEIYWYMGTSKSKIPRKWSSAYSAKYNESNPLRTEINPSKVDQYDIYFTSSPIQLCSTGRTNDLDAILSIINNAQKFIYIAVMDYFPMFLYEKQKTYWPLIDDALRKAVVERKVQVRLMASHWNHTRPALFKFLKSLSALNNDDNGGKPVFKGSIQTKVFTFPAFETDIPFSEVNHNKYMVTDQVAYIGTSNWSADYFVNTGGVGIILKVTDQNQSAIYNQTKNIFLRDWNSNYAKNI